MTSGRHRPQAPPPPPPRPLDRWTVLLGTACTVLIAASLIAFYGPGVAPDASAAGREELVPTASPTRRTVQVPLEILPVTPPSIGAEGAWDPATDSPLPGNDSGIFAGASGSASVEVPSSQTAPLTTTPPELTPDPVPAPDTAQSTNETYSGSPDNSTASTTTTPEPTTDAPPPDPTEEPTMPTDPLDQIIDDVLEP